MDERAELARRPWGVPEKPETMELCRDEVGVNGGDDAMVSEDLRGRLGGEIVGERWPKQVSPPLG